MKLKTRNGIFHGIHNILCIYLFWSWYNEHFYYKFKQTNKKFRFTHKKGIEHVSNFSEHVLTIEQQKNLCFFF